MLKIKNKKAQSAIEMCICIPIFMVCIFGAYDLTLMISGLMDTMIIARDSLREMTLIKEDNVVETAKKTANGLALRSKAPFITFDFTQKKNLNIQSGPPKHNSPQLVQVCSQVHLLVPWMWGLRNNEPMNVCASYYMLRQYQK